MEDKEIQDALDAVCDVGPYDLLNAESNERIQVWQCQACGAKLRRDFRLTQPTWLHEKPWARDEPKQSTKTTITLRATAPPGTTFSIESLSQSLPSGALLGSHNDFSHVRVAPPPLYALNTETNPALDEDRVRALIAEAIEAAEDHLVERVFNKLVVRLRTRTLP